MALVSWPLVKEHFNDALALDASRRQAFLTALDAATRTEVQALLDAADADAFFDRPLDSALLPTGVERAATDSADATESTDDGTGPLTGAAVGPYRVGPRIGRGGMGDVYRARRADGLFDRAVALKVVRPGADSDAVLARFAAERRILGALEHPGIARLIAAGVETDGPATGRPWLALELVDGVPITEATADLDTEARVALLADVAEAVHHAHRSLVVHRDLKPSNVLVSTDEQGARHPRLLDFGIAKLLDPEIDPALTELSARTPMTRAYAAPEQIRRGVITTATDVYGLGLLLFEVLTGRRPFAVGDDVRELERQILHDDPPLPSTVADGPAARRLRGDLDVICRTALAKEPEARYASAAALAADLRRWLAAEPVEARAPTAAYRARRFVQRHRLGVAAAALVLLAVGVGVASTLWQARQARAQAERSAATSAFLVSLFGDADPAAVQGDTLSALDLLDRGARRIEAELADQPALQADLYRVVGEAFGSLGEAERAARFARRALAVRRPGGAAPDPAAAVQAQIAWGSAAGAARGDSLLRDAVRQARAIRNPEPLLDALYAVALHQDAQRSVGAEAELLDEAIALHRRHHGPGDPHLGVLASRLATATIDVGDYARAETLLRDALRVLPAPAFARDRLPVLQDLANILSFTNRRRDAIRLAEEALTIARQLYGDAHRRTASAHETLGAALAEEDAVGHVRQAVQILEAGGAPPADLVPTYLHLYNAVASMGRTADAVPPARRAAEIARRLPADDPQRATSQGILALALTLDARHAEAAPVWTEALALHRQIYGERSPVTLLHLLRNARAARQADEAATGAAAWTGTGRSAAGRRAARLYATADSLALDALPATSHTRAVLAYERGRFLLAAGRAQAAAEPLRRAVAARDVLGRAGVDSFPSVTSQGDQAEATLGRALLALGRRAAARRHLARAAPALADSLGADHPDAVVARDALRAARTAR